MNMMKHYEVWLTPHVRMERREGWNSDVHDWKQIQFWDLNHIKEFFLKVFDVVLNGDLTIASDLDVFERVGRGVAHDEYIDFEVKDGKILYEGDESEISAGKIRVEFIKSYRDNPKVNAIIVGKGSLSGNSYILLLDVKAFYKLLDNNFIC